MKVVNCLFSAALKAKIIFSPRSAHHKPPKLRPKLVKGIVLIVNKQRRACTEKKKKQENRVFALMQFGAAGCSSIVVDVYAENSYPAHLYSAVFDLQTQRESISFQTISIQLQRQTDTRQQPGIIRQFYARHKMNILVCLKSLWVMCVRVFAVQIASIWKVRWGHE